MSARSVSVAMRVACSRSCAVRADRQRAVVSGRPNADYDHVMDLATQPGGTKPPAGRGTNP